MVSDRDTLEYLLLSARIDAKTTDETVDDILDAGWRPPARVIETDAELNDVPPGIVVRAKDGTIAARYDRVHGVVFGDDRPFPWSVLRAPATVLYEPGQEAQR